MAADVGKTLLQEVEEVVLEEILESIRLKHEPDLRYFNFPPLDRLLRTILEARPASKGTTTQPIVELMSLAAGDGKTHLLYHLCAQAILPDHLGGKQATVAVIDANGQFNVQRLATHIQQLLRERNISLSEAGDSTQLDQEILSALKHVHIFRPQALDATTATLDALPQYLFDHSRHHSYDREVAFVALDPASAFYWQDRAETEDAAFIASTDAPSTNSNTQSGYFQLSRSLKAACQALCCPAIITTWHVGISQSAGNAVRSVRPQLPALQPTLRMIIHRISVRKFPPGITLEQAVREGPSRQKAAEDGRSECFLNEHEMDERLLRALRGKGSGFGYAIGSDGMTILESGERDEEKNVLA